MSVDYVQLEELIQSVLAPQPAQISRIKELLVEYGTPAVPRLCEILPSASERSKWIIINVLAKIPDPQVMPVIAKYLYSENQAIQALAAQYLGDSGDKAAVPFLVEALQILDDSSSVVWVAHALGRLKDRRAVRPLMNLVSSTSAPVVRYTTIKALGEIGDPEAISLIKHYENDTNHHVREHSQHALDLLNRAESV